YYPIVLSNRHTTFFGLALRGLFLSGAGVPRSAHPDRSHRLHWQGAFCEMAPQSFIPILVTALAWVRSLSSFRAERSRSGMEQFALYVVLPLILSAFVYLALIIPVEMFNRRLATVAFKRRLF